MSIVFISHVNANDYLMFRATIRGTNRPGVFQFFFNGDDLNFKSLKENHGVETVQKTINAIIGRDDIKIGEIIWQGEWRSVILVTVSNTKYLFFFRPNIRMADHYRVGRVFLAGGQTLSAPSAPC